MPWTSSYGRYKWRKNNFFWPYFFEGISSYFDVFWMFSWHISGENHLIQCFSMIYIIINDIQSYTTWLKTKTNHVFFYFFWLHHGTRTIFFKLLGKTSPWPNQFCKDPPPPLPLSKRKRVKCPLSWSITYINTYPPLFQIFQI